MFNVEDRDRARARLLELADADERMVAAAVVGAEARLQIERDHGLSGRFIRWPVGQV